MSNLSTLGQNFSSCARDGKNPYFILTWNTKIMPKSNKVAWSKVEWTKYHKFRTIVNVKDCKYLNYWVSSFIKLILKNSFFGRIAKSSSKDQKLSSLKRFLANTINHSAVLRVLIDVTYRPKQTPHDIVSRKSWQVDCMYWSLQPKALQCSSISFLVMKFLVLLAIISLFKKNNEGVGSSEFIIATLKSNSWKTNIV